jgi:hypothetical protein
MKTPIPVLFLLLSFTAASSFAGGWVLMTPEFAVTEAKVAPTEKWLALESFSTELQCNDQRSSMIRQIDKERHKFRNVKDPGVAIETARELRLLWQIYTHSKCVSSR